MKKCFKLSEIVSIPIVAPRSTPEDSLVHEEQKVIGSCYISSRITYHDTIEDAEIYAQENKIDRFDITECWTNVF